jgi:hypothetical protein
MSHDSIPALILEGSQPVPTVDEDVLISLPDNKERWEGLHGLFQRPDMVKIDPAGPWLEAGVESERTDHQLHDGVNR